LYIFNKYENGFTTKVVLINTSEKAMTIVSLLFC